MEARRIPRPPSPGPAAPYAASPGIDSLPSEILEKVLSSLPVRDAVRTSAVSRAWRRLWESAPGLDLEWGPGADPAAAGAVLARYSGPVRSFRFDHLPAAEFWRAGGWVVLLAGKGVRALKIHFNQERGAEYHVVDAAVFSCRELTCLDLAGCDIPPAPSGFAGFPNLTRLYLQRVGFLDNWLRGLKALIAESPLLEVLCFDELWIPEDSGDEEKLVIQAPNLRSLRIVSEVDYGWQVEELLPCIQEAEINSTGYRFNRDFVKLLMAMAPVRKLYVKMPFRESNALEGLSCTFENLKDLSLHTNFCTLPNIFSTLCLLKNAPNLEKLLLEICIDNLHEVEVSVDLLNAELADSLLSNLKSVSIDLATCQPNEMHFIEFVLSKAQRLQEFHVRVYEECAMSNEELLVEITKYRRASPEAKVFFRREEYLLRKNK